MTSPKVWYTGLNNFKKHTLDSNKFETELIDQDFESDRPLDVMITDSLKGLSNHFDVLYSGGTDSELVLKSLLKHNIPVTAITLKLTIDDCIINTHDLYYAEKFCRENSVKQVIHTLDVNDFFNSGKHEEYLLPYNITQPHVSTHFWLLEQCHNFSLMGGDWPWVQQHKTPNVLSPIRLDYSCYELFLQDRNLSGIGNMLSYSYELAYGLSKRQMRYPNINGVHLVKQKMYGDLEPRFRSYGWERLPQQVFNSNKYYVGLVTKIGIISNSIRWGEKYKELINSEAYTNDKYK